MNQTPDITLTYDEFDKVWRATVVSVAGYSCCAPGQTPVEAIKSLKEKLKNETFKPGTVKEVLRRM